VTGNFWHRVICTSPVPGGMSITSASSSPQATCVINCCSAPISIGPRQTSACSSGSIMPMEMTFTPCASGGIMVLPSGDEGRLVTPIMRGWLGP